LLKWLKTKTSMLKAAKYSDMLMSTSEATVSIHSTIAAICTMIVNEFYLKMKTKMCSLYKMQFEAVSDSL